MKVVLVLHDFCRGWIIEKMALKLCEALVELGIDATVSAEPSTDVAVNHFMIFHYVDGPPRGVLNTMAVTHVDDMLKVDIVRRHLSGHVRAAVCMSTMTVDQLADYGIDRARLTYALPAHDNEMTPRRLVIGITSNVYSDGRKRDWLLTKLAEDMDLGDFEFQIFGRGWDEVAPKLRAGGAAVTLVPPTADYAADYEAIKAAVPRFDYYFYPGLDEGSLGTLDALSAGVKTIVTRQGFHIDIPNGMTHGFWDYPELLGIFRQISAERRGRIDPARSMTWTRYAQRHLDIWTALLAGDALPGPDLLEAPESIAPPPAPLSVVGGAVERYPMAGYGEIMRDKYRREMALRFWAPGPYQAYLDLRGRAGRVLKRLRGAS